MKIMASQYLIAQNRHGFWDVRRKGAKKDVGISKNLTQKIDADLLVAELAAGSITERECRQRSVLDNSPFV